MNSRARRLLLLAVAAPLLPACDPTVNNDDPGFATTIRVSVGLGGAEANEASTHAQISADGRYVVFESKASNLHPDDTDNASDIFRRDTLLGVTTLVSRASGPAGAKGNATSFRPSMSSDGRWVCFKSLATNLDPVPPTSLGQNFLRDLLNETTIQLRHPSGLDFAFSDFPAISPNGEHVGVVGENVSLYSTLTQNTVVAAGALQIQGENTFHASPLVVASNGAIAFNRNLTQFGFNIFELQFKPLGMPETTVTLRPNGFLGFSQESVETAITPDGQVVAFSSASAYLAPGLDSNMAKDVYLWIAATGAFERVSLANAGVEAAPGPPGQFGNLGSSKPSMSADARYVSFESYAANLVNGDTNAVPDIFIRDRTAGTTIRVSVRTFGDQASDASTGASISADGRWVAFQSLATDMVGGDNNNASDIFLRGPLR